MIEASLAEKLKEKISAFSEYKIFTHKNPDGDALGSVLALKRILELKNKSSEIFVFNSIGAHFYFLPGIEEIRTQKEFKDSVNSPALFVLIDCASWGRTGFPFFDFAEKEVIAVDHHPKRTDKEPLALEIIDPSASSAAEIIFALARELNWKIDPETSFCLLAGILSDTGAFRHSNTSPKALEAVSTLMKNGVNIKKIADNLFKKNEFPGQLKLLGKVLSRASLEPRIRMAFSFADDKDMKKHGAEEEDLSGLANLLSGIPESRFGMLLVETGAGKIKARLRSEMHKGVDVARIARIFGGGGHKLAAGFEIEGKIEERFEMIKEKIAKEIGMRL